MAEEQKVAEKKEKFQSPASWIGVIAALLVLIIIISILVLWGKPEIIKEYQTISPIGSRGGFPLIPYLIIAGGLIIYATVKEYLGIRKNPEATAVSRGMAVVAVVILSAAIFFFEANYPDWWSNVWASKAGWLPPALLLMSIFGWYCLPGTGKITLGKSGKFLVAVIMIASFAFFISIATGNKFSFPDFTENAKKEYQATQAQAALPPPPQVIPAPPPPPSNKYKLCWDKPPGYRGRNPGDRHKCFDTEIDLVGESLLAKLHFQHQQEWQIAKFIGSKTDSDIYEGDWNSDNPLDKGKFFFRFTPDRNSVSGWISDDYEPGQIPVQLFRKTT